MSAQLVFFANPAPRLPLRRGARMSARVALGSTLVHAAAIVLLLALTAARSSATRAESPPRVVGPVERTRLVFVPSQVPGGGGGGGGNRQPGPVRRAEAPSRDRVGINPVPRAARPLPAPSPLPEVAVQTAILDAAPMASGTQFLAGLPSATPSGLAGLGPGEGGGVGSGVGTGIGSGRGSGLGPGSGGGFGGGAYRVGGGVTAPRVLKQVRPSYTLDALRARIQGFVELEVVVRADGTPGPMRVVRSLDPGGLDVSAIDTVRQWRFAPGELGGVPVDVLVTVILTFQLS